MFNLLKGKLKSFTEKLKGKAEEKPAVPVPEPEPEPLPEQVPTAEPVPKPALEPEPQPAPETAAEPEPRPEPEQVPEPAGEPVAEPRLAPEPEPAPKPEEPSEEPSPEPELEKIEIPSKAPGPGEEIKEIEKLPEKEIAEPAAPAPAEEEKRELVARVRKREKFKGMLRGYVELKESDVRELLSELELSLLEADVSQRTAEAFISKIRQELLSKKIPKGSDMQEFLNEEIKKILFDLTQTKTIDFLSLVRDSRKPFKILFLGPNGAGKTTTIAKLTAMLKEKGMSSIWAASDTFRAASIEQLEEHASCLGVRVIKHNYGADPAAVAFDAVKAAETARMDVVMIDTAGRQETNRNLIEELKKLERVVKPDLKIFVGEAFAGKNLVEQAREFDSALDLDAFILTKIDTDPKGGTTLSLLFELKKPILFLGTGQEYSEIIPFSQEFIIERIV